jgi:hypothetical protein
VADQDNNGGWNEWSKYVLKEIVRLTHTQEIQQKKIEDHSIILNKVTELSDSQKKQQKTLEEHTLEIAKLKLKFTIYGGIAAFIVSLIFNLIIKFWK